jgi:hypothetical protein
MPPALEHFGHACHAVWGTASQQLLPFLELAEQVAQMRLLHKECYLSLLNLLTM